MTTTPPRPDIRRKARAQLLLTLILVVVLAAAGFALLFTQPLLGGMFFVGYGILMLLVLTSVLWVSLILYAAFALTSDARLRTLEAAHPGATLVHAVVTVPVLRQLRALATTLGMPRSKLRARTYVTLAIDPKNITFYGGGNPPVAQMTLPRGSVTAADLTTTKAGRKQLPSIRLHFATTASAAGPSGTEPVTLVPVYWPGVAPKPVPQEALEALIAAINAQRP